MPPDHRSSRDAFDASILESQALESPEGITHALRAIDTACQRGGPEVELVIAALNSRPYLLEYMISGTLIEPPASQTLIVLLSSSARENIQDISEVGLGRVPYFHNAECDGHHVRGSPLETLTFFAICRISTYRQGSP